MKYLIWGGMALAALAIGAWLVLADGWRTVQTVRLILATEPFQQTIEGAPTILVLGDSTAYGTGVRDARDSVPGQVGAAWPEYSVQTIARNGWQLGDVATYVEQELTSTEYAAVIVQAGANDIIQDVPLTSSEAHLRQIVSQLQTKTDHIVWLHNGNIGAASGFTGRTAERLTARSRTFREMATTTAAELDIGYVDLFQEPDTDPFVAEPERYLAADGIHLTPAGYQLWFQELRPVLADRLESTVE